MAPDLYIIAGPNGAGKTTFARRFLPAFADCRNFVNADLIAQGVSPFWPEAAAFRAGRLMLQEIARLEKREESFGFESTLSGKAHLHLIRRLKQRGYVVHLFFLWVPAVEVAVYRVQGRVTAGGHDIPEAVIRRRFDRSVRNFFHFCRSLADTWILFDNSAEAPVIIALRSNHAVRIMLKELYDRLSSKYGAAG